MKTNFIGNPYYCYILAFGSVLFIYLWGWSEIYPDLTLEVILFLIISFAISFMIGKSIEYKLFYRNIATDEKNKLVVIAIILGYILEFVYNKGIPLVSLLKGIEISYMEFGIPTFHVILHTFSGFYTVYIFHQYISSKRKSIFMLCVVLIIPNVLIINRAAVIMTLAACVIIYFLSKKKILIRQLSIALFCLCVFFYGFGYLGNIRSFNGDAKALPNYLQATSDFKEGNIPDEFFWFYIYASSPIANFQNTTISNIKHTYNIAGFIIWELLPDFISKRLIPIEADYDGMHRTDYSISPMLTVGSVYFEPFIRIGWYGPIIIFLFYCIVIYIYIRIFPNNSRFFLSSVAILCVISIFNVFENMLNFSGLVFQLVYPLVFSLLEQHKIKFVLVNVNRVNLYVFNRKIRLF